VDDAWMMGDRVLVAAMFADEPGRSLTMPPGDWHNFWTGEVVKGGTKLTFAASEKNLPVFVKAGSVLPLAAVTNSTTDADSKKLEVKVFGDGSLPFELHAPDGAVLMLAWDAAAKAGKVEQAGGSAYRVKGWN